MKHRILSVFTVLLVLSLAFSSCASQSNGSEWKADSNYAAAAPMETADAYYDYDAGGGWAGEYETEAAPAEAKTESGVGNDLASRKIIKNANVSFETTAYDEFLASLTRCVAEYGGFIESSDTWGEGLAGRRDRSASVTARIPAARYDAFLEAAGTLGSVTYRSERMEDVTMSYVDTESHIRALETEYNTLLNILAKAETMDDVVTLQSRISELNYQMDSYKSQLRKYDDLISYCTVYINVSEVARQTPPEPKTLTFGERIGVGLRENLYDIGEGFSDFAVWFVTNLPYLLIWAAVIAGIVFLVRALIRRARRKKERKIAEAYMRSLTDETEKKEHTENNP